MSTNVVLGEYTLPIWAIQIIESDEESEDDRADELYDWLDEFESCGTPSLVVIDKVANKVPHALFGGAKNPSKKVMLVGVLSNVAKIKRHYATLGSQGFFSKLTAAQNHFMKEREGQANIGTVPYEQWQEIAKDCPISSNDLDKIIDWCKFNNPLCQVWASWAFEQ